LEFLMAGRREIRCIGPSFPLPDRKTSCQRSINWRLRQIQSLGEEKQLTLAPTPGMAVEIDFGAPTRCIFSTGSREFVVAGTTLFETTSGAAVAVGEVAGSGPVNAEEGSNQIVFVTGLQGYVLNKSSTTLAEISDPDWRGSYDVAELNGTFIFVALDEPEQFFLSAIDDGSQLDALDFSSSDAQPDPLITVRVSKQEVYFFGSRSTEVWIYDGDAEFPLVRYNSTPIDVGIVGRRAVIKAADTLIFVGCTERGTGIVYMMAGHQPTRISNDAVEESLQASGVDLTQCSMWVRQTVGAEFVGINAPGMETTWVWDASTREWHEQAEKVNGAWTPLRTVSIASLGSSHHAIAGNKMYRIDDALGTIDGEPIVQERTWPHLLSPSMEPVPYRSLELACTTGGEIAADITLETSNDGGYVFSAPRLQSLGAVGRRMQPVRWQYLGSAVDRVFRLRKSAPTPVTLHACNLDAG
jgi:hypothetical protein